MWKEWHKDDKVFTFEMSHKVFDPKHNEHVFRKDLLLEEGYTEMFDRRVLHFSNGKVSSIILENDTMPPDYIVDFQSELKSYNSKKQNENAINHQIVSLQPHHIPELKQQILDKQIKNILIDSLFQDMEQFRYLIINCFSDCIDCNFFINSRGVLKDILNIEFDVNSHLYPVRNPSYKRADGKEWFNELAFVLIKNNVYEIEADCGNVTQMKRLKFLQDTNKEYVDYVATYKFIYGEYKCDDSDITPTQNKSKWSNS